jgi:hypothetical protein
MLKRCNNKNLSLQSIRKIILKQILEKKDVLLNNKKKEEK